MVINDIKIKQKFNMAKDYITLINSILELSLEEYLDNFENQVLAERSFEVLTQIILDVCTHIIAMSGISAPSSYSDCIIKLASLKILENDESIKYSKLIGMRNIIVHQYNTINHSLLYESLSILLHDFNNFQFKILKWLEKNK